MAANLVISDEGFCIGLNESSENVLDFRKENITQNGKKAQLITL